MSPDVGDLSVKHEGGFIYPYIYIYIYLFIFLWLICDFM